MTAHHSNFTIDTFQAELQSIAKVQGCTAHDRNIAQALDDIDPLASLRDGYILPTKRDAGVKEADPSEPSLYLCGNSLGPLTKRSKQLLHREIDVWGQKAVLGHFDHPHDDPWVKQEERVAVLMADIVGAKTSEVTAMSTLTQNLHTMLATFYRPTSLPSTVPSLGTSTSTSSPKRKHKIVYEARAFPSDQYALASVVALHGLDPDRSLHALKPREGTSTLDTQDILKELEALAEEGETALVMLGGIQYYTGQWFDMATITRRARELGLLVGWDLAHAFANVPLRLHDWGVDFAVWCTYKYGSSGPGGIAGAFVHERWGSLEGSRDGTDNNADKGLVRPAGWWGHRKSTRFAMPDQFDPMPGAAGWQLSNPSVLDLASLRGSLETLSGAAKLDSGPAAPNGTNGSHDDTVGEGTIMPPLRAKSLRLTAYLEHLLLAPGFLPAACGASLVTPRDPHQRGSQLSVRIKDVLRPPTHTSSDDGNNGTNDAPPTSASSAASAPEAEAGAAAAKDSSSVPPPISRSTLVARAHTRAERTHGLIADIRNPDIIRLAPLAQFSRFVDVWDAARALRDALRVEVGEE